MGPLLGGRPTVRYGAGVNIVCDGNSLTRGYGAPTAGAYPIQLAALPPLNGAVAVTNLGGDSQNTTDMRNRGAATDAKYVAGKKNILIAWEGTNQICNVNAKQMNAAGAANEMQLYMNERLAAHPDWLIVLLTTLPRFDQQNDIVTQNQSLLDYNNLLIANWRTMGAKGIVDVRATGLFAWNGTNSYFNTPEAPYMSDTIHLKDTGYGMIAGYVANTLMRLPAR